MASDKQIEANRLNSEKSTGPKTEEGKAIVSQNAIKHGLLASQNVLHWESVSTFEDLRQSLIDTLQPANAIEMIIVERIISATWRLKRAGLIETGIYKWKRYVSNADLAEAEIYSYVRNKRLPDMAITDETINDQLQQAFTERLQRIHNDVSELGLIFEKNINAFANLSRHEMNLEKSLYKALHELQRLQAYRLGKDVRLPVAIDIHGDEINSSS